MQGTRKPSGKGDQLSDLEKTEPLRKLLLESVEGAASEDLSAVSRDLEAGGPPLWEQLMADLRATHLGATAPSERSR